MNLEPIIEAIRQGFAEASTPRLWDARDVYTYLGVGRHKFVEIKKGADFPKPAVIGKSERWFPDEIRAWAERQRKRTPGRPRG